MERRVYPIWRPLRLAMIVGGAIIAGYALAGVYTTAPAPLVAHVALLVVLFLPGLFIIIHAFRSKLITSPEGVEYQSTFYSVVSSWDNIERIDTARRNRDAFYLKEGGYRGPIWLRPLILGSKRDRVITISLHLPNWWAGPLFQDIQRYAPHLLARRQ